MGMTWSPRALIQLLASTLSAGCSNGDGAMSTASIMPPSSPAEVTKPDALSRPLAVAWTSARAKRCGFAFDPAELRTLYLAFEAKQGAADDAYARIEKAYDTSYRLTLEKRSQLLHRAEATPDQGRS